MGRRGGKSWLAMNEMAKIARFPNKIVWYVAPTYKMCKQIIWDELKDKLTAINWVSKTNETDLTILLRNGSKICLRGADNPDSLRGVSLDFVVFDEFAYIEERAWKEVIRPTLSNREGSAMFITTPNGNTNWSYNLFQRGKNPDEKNWKSFQYTTLEGGFVSAEEIEQAKQDLDIRTFNQEFRATFETYANRIFYAFDIEKNVRKWEKETPRALYIGCDFNVGMMSAVVFAREGEVIHAIDEIAIYGSNTDELVDEIKLRYPNNRIIMFPDPAGNQRKTSASGKTDITILRNAGFETKFRAVTISVRDGNNAVNSKLCSANGQRTLFVDPKCKKTVESLNKHSYKEGSSQPDKDSGFDHFADAIRYYVDYDFPVKRDTKQEEPRRFGVAMA
jgi:phage terminase large subunit